MRTKNLVLVAGRDSVVKFGLHILGLIRHECMYNSTDEVLVTGLIVTMLYVCRISGQTG